jgi:hypothetical protein
MLTSPYPLIGVRFRPIPEVATVRLKGGFYSFSRSVKILVWTLQKSGIFGYADIQVNPIFMTKPEVIAKLKELGIEDDASASKADVEALLPKDSGSGEDPKETGPKDGVRITIRFRDHNGEPTERTYSKEEHGDDYAKLADEFRRKHAKKRTGDVPR